MTLVPTAVRFVSGAVASLLALAVVGHAADGEVEVKPGRRMAVIDTAHIHALVPAESAERLRFKVQQAEAIYVHLAADAGYEITERLTLWISDDVDTHNGFSTVVPLPLVEIELAPSLPRSGIFDGSDEFVRTVTHELTHHITNNRVYGLPHYTDMIFGRVFPTDFLSLITAYFTVPPHATMPTFWHEGLAQWAETAYADPTSAWAGRGRDSLTHLVWRMDAEADAIPPVDDWRDSYIRWPYGNNVYLYGMAYTRWLDAAFGDRASLWRISDVQAHQWAFIFDSGPMDLIGLTHADLIGYARADLLTEQRAQLALINQVPTTQPKRLTEVDDLVAAPGWLADGSLLTSFTDPWGVDRLAVIGADGSKHTTGAEATSRGEVRSLPDGTAIYAEELGINGDRWARSRAIIRSPDGALEVLDGERLLQPDLRGTAPLLQTTAVRLLPGGRQEIVLGLPSVGSFSSRTWTWTTFPTQDRAWSPTFRPGHDELTWVETDASGSRLVLAPLVDPTQRTVLATVHGRLLHPSWTADGSSLFVCADHTGVPNAYRIDADKPGVLVPVTNVTGAVIACVPRPDGKELALVAFDRHGPFLARIANDPAQFPPSVPSIDLRWPAPIPRRHAPTPISGDAHPTTPVPPLDPAAPLPDVSSYWGLKELQFLFWSPTTLVTPQGGVGVEALAADPLNTNQLQVGVGVGDAYNTPIGYANYTWSPYLIGLSASTWRSEVTYVDEVIAANQETYNYTETEGTVEVRAGYHLLGNQRRIRANVAVGSTQYKAVEQSTDTYAGQTIISATPFVGHERYIEYSIGYSDTANYPTSYTKEDGPSLIATYRDSGLGGDLYRKVLAASGSYTWSLFPKLGHQIVLGGNVGWSNPDQATSLQGVFSIGGKGNPFASPAYPDRIVSGYYLLGYSTAYRLPVWRPFDNFGTTPFGFRQLVLEAWYDGSMVSTDQIHGNGDWYRAVGGTLYADWQVWALRLDTGIGVGQQLDGNEATTVFVQLGYRW